METRRDMAGQGPILSIIVPAYNSENTIERCVRSIQRRKNISIEIILVDDGSRDNTGLICDSLASEDHRIKVIRKANGGAGSARNTGIAAASGKYLSFVDADDTVSPDMHEHMLRLIQQRDTDCVMCNATSVFTTYTESMRHTFGAQTIQGNQNIYQKIIIPLLVPGHRDAALLASVWNKIYRADIIREHQLQFHHLPRAEDWLFNIEYFKYAQSIAFTEESLYLYDRSTDGSLSKSWDLNNFNHGLWIQEHLAELFPERYPKDKLPHTILDMQANELRLYTTCCGLKGLYRYSVSLFEHEKLRSAYGQIQALPGRYKFPNYCIRKDWRIGYFLWCIYTARMSLLKCVVRPAYRKFRYILHKLRRQ